MARSPRDGKSTGPGDNTRLVQPKSRNAMADDPSANRYAHAPADADADSVIRGARARGRHLRSTVGDSLPAGRNHGGQSAAVHAGRGDTGNLGSAGRPVVVPDSVCRIVPDALCEAE